MFGGLYNEIFYNKIETPSIYYETPQLLVNFNSSICWIISNLQLLFLNPIISNWTWDDSVLGMISQLYHRKIDLKTFVSYIKRNLKSPEIINGWNSCESFYELILEPLIIKQMDDYTSKLSSMIVVYNGKSKQISKLVVNVNNINDFFSEKYKRSNLALIFSGSNNGFGDFCDLNEISLKNGYKVIGILLYKNNHFYTCVNINSKWFNTDNEINEIKEDYFQNLANKKTIIKGIMIKTL